MLHHKKNVPQKHRINLIDLLQLTLPGFEQD